MFSGAPQEKRTHGAIPLYLDKQQLQQYSNKSISRVAVTARQSWSFPSSGTCCCDSGLTSLLCAPQRTTWEGDRAYGAVERSGKLLVVLKARLLLPVSTDLGWCMCS